MNSIDWSKRHNKISLQRDLIESSDIYLQGTLDEVNVAGMVSDQFDKNARLYYFADKFFNFEISKKFAKTVRYKYEDSRVAIRKIVNMPSGVNIFSPEALSYKDVRNVAIFDFDTMGILTNAVVKSTVEFIAAKHGHHKRIVLFLNIVKAHQADNEYRQNLHNLETLLDQMGWIRTKNAPNGIYKYRDSKSTMAVHAYFLEKL